MSSTQTSNEPPTPNSTAATVDQKLEVIVLPVADVNRAKRFYQSLGWRMDGDFTDGKDWRVVQMTPPGSPVLDPVRQRIHGRGAGLDAGKLPRRRQRRSGTSRSHRTRRRCDRGVPFRGPPASHRCEGTRAGPGPAEVNRTSSWASFSDPDGNSWLLQEIQTRLPGRGLSNFDVATLTALLRETEEHHGPYEATAPKHHWSDWYAAYMVARQQGKTPEEAAKDGALHMESARV